METTAAFDHVWWWRARLPDRKGQRCRVLVRGSRNSVLVEFADGWTVVTSRYAVRRAVNGGGAAQAPDRPVRRRPETWRGDATQP